MSLQVAVFVLYFILSSYRLFEKINSMNETMCMVVAASSMAPMPRRRGLPERKTDIKFDAVKPFEYSEYIHGAPTYTIISHQHKKTIYLIDEMRRHRINYVFIDAGYFTQPELLEICKFYKIANFENAPNPNIVFSHPMHLHLYKDALVFMEDKEYVGGIFEMYETIFRYGGCV